MRMTKSRGINRAKWVPTAADIVMLQRHYATTRTADLAAALGVAYHQVGRLALKLGLRKDEAWLNGPEGGRTDGQRGLGTRFQKGQVPPNKGKKLGPDWSKATQFRPGQKPRNYAPPGSLRVATVGYLQIKVHDTGYPPHDWVMYHRYVWEQAHGPVPAEHVVAFKDGRRRIKPEEITLEVLECISRQEHMRRHTYYQYGPEVAGVVHLRGRLTRAIRNREKEAQT